jgi:hypothetical protein
MNPSLPTRMFPFPGPDPLPPFPPAPFPPIPFPEPWPPHRPVELPDIKVKWPIRYGPAQVKILIVMDGGSYNTTDSFGLGIMLKDAFDAAHPDHPDYARFAFTKAHRTTFPPATKAADEAAAGITPNFSAFTFSDASLAGFHEVWLFGVSTAAPYIVGTELDAITRFMNNGGGVLAMGDHEDLGLGLCGNIPRVKSMRKWWYNAGRPPGEPKAPDSTDLTRNDTVQFVGGADPGFGGQSDSVAQPVYPNYRYGQNWWNPRRWFRYPHPVLCGPRGVITVFPDHAHEGDCIVPPVLDPAQYPGGVAPEVIANGRNVVGREKGGFVISDPRPFGLLGAYDGHLPAANVGRIVVDSTWHHWFNINLLGLDAPSIAAQSTQYRDILAYFRNVAVWLAPQERQNRMRLTGQLIFLFTPSMIETTLTISEFNVEKFIWWGIEARDALGRLAPKCQANAWFIDLFAPFLPAIAKRFPIDPEKQPMPDPWQAYVEDYVFTTALGGAVAAMAIAARKSNYLEGDALIESADKIMAEGIRVGIEHAHKQLQAQTEEFRGSIERLRAGMQKGA